MKIETQSAYICNVNCSAVTLFPLLANFIHTHIFIFIFLLNIYSQLFSRLHVAFYSTMYVTVHKLRQPKFGWLHIFIFLLDMSTNQSHSTGCRVLYYVTVHKLCLPFNRCFQQREHCFLASVIMTLHGAWRLCRALVTERIIQCLFLF